jgi:hypothetical protein
MPGQLEAGRQPSALVTQLRQAAPLHTEREGELAAVAEVGAITRQRIHWRGRAYGIP